MSAEGMQYFNIGMGAVTSAISGVAQYKQGRAQQAAYEYNADIALENMRQNEEASRQKFTVLMGRQRMLYAAAGVDLTSGSPLLVLADTAMKAEMESSRIKTAGESESELQRYYGRVAAFGGKIGGLTTFLTGLGRAGTQLLQMQEGG
jgi:hypothetical protein